MQRVNSLFPPKKQIKFREKVNLNINMKKKIKN